MGAGLGVVVPVLFRAAGSTPGVSASVGYRGRLDRSAGSGSSPARRRSASPPARSGCRAALGIVVVATRSSRRSCSRSAGAARSERFRGVLFEPRAVLSDLDGVLVDSGAAIEDTWRRFAEQHGLDAASTCSRRATAGAAST